jgi:UDP-MurNAc hydroxylase
MQPIIKWVNHASFCYSDGSINLISDPWIIGSAFNNGWSHVSECALTSFEWAEVTHIWISHEHPDHFSPPSLKAIPSDIRKSITALYQRSADQRVAEFLRKCGFAAVLELDQTWYSLSPQTQIFCLPLKSDTNDDSALVIRTGEFVTVNFNDCVFSSRSQRKSMMAVAPKVDLLLAQFAYASWAGNPEEIDRKKAAGDRAARVFMDNVAFFNPKWVIPCASNVWFSNTENFHLNVGLYTLRDIDALTRKESPAETVILYPKEEWRLGDLHDNALSLKLYDADYEKIDEDHAFDNPVITEEQLQESASRFLTDIKALNNPLLLAMLPKSNIFVHDLAKSFVLSRAGFAQSGLSLEECDVCLGSESLQYCFKHLWGGDTLNINGRFTKPSGGVFWHFIIYFAIAALNNVGTRFDFSFLVKNAVSVVKKILEYRFVQSR